MDGRRGDLQRFLPPEHLHIKPSESLFLLDGIFDMAALVASPDRASGETGRDSKRPRVPAEVPPLPAFGRAAASPRAAIDIEGLLGAHSATILANHAALLRAYDQQVQARFGEVERDVARLSTAQEKQASENDSIWASIAALQAGLAVAETLEPPAEAPCYDPSFDRQVDTTIIKVNLAMDVARTLVQEALLASLTAAANDAWKIEGPDCGQRFTIKFAGAGGIAAKRAAKFQHNMRLADGSFARFFVAAAGGQNVEVFTAPDKSPETVRTEIMARRLKKTIDKLHPALASKTRCNKKDGTVSVDWVAVARVVVASKEAPVKVVWNLAACAIHNIEPETARCQFDEATASASSSAAITWSG